MCGFLGGLLSRISNFMGTKQKAELNNSCGNFFFLKKYEVRSLKKKVIEKEILDHF